MTHRPSHHPGHPAEPDAHPEATTQPPSATPITSDPCNVDDARTRRGASNSLRPPYGQSQAQAPAEGGGGDPARAPGTGAGAAAADGEAGHPSAVPPSRAAPSSPHVERASAAAAARRTPKRRLRNTAQHKEARVTVRFDADEMRRLKAEAAAANLTLAHLIARRALEADPGADGQATAPRTGTSSEQMDAAIDELAATRAELGACGNNLNQIARQLNAGGALPLGLVADVAAVVPRLLAEVRELAAVLDGSAHRVAKRRGRV